MLNAMDRFYFAASLKMHQLKNAAGNMWQEMKEDEKGGMSTVVIEIVMVGMILVLGFVFRKQIGDLLTSLWNSLVKFDSSTTDPSISSVSNPFG